MSFFDQVVNKATDTVKASAEGYQRSQRRKLLSAQLAEKRAAMDEAVRRLGRLALEASNLGRPLPDEVAPAAAAVRKWETEVAALKADLAALDAQIAADADANARAGAASADKAQTSAAPAEVERPGQPAAPAPPGTPAPPGQPDPP